MPDPRMMPNQAELDWALTIADPFGTVGFKQPSLFSHLSTTCRTHILGQTTSTSTGICWFRVQPAGDDNGYNFVIGNTAGSTTIETLGTNT